MAVEGIGLSKCESIDGSKKRGPIGVDRGVSNVEGGKGGANGRRKRRKKRHADWRYSGQEVSG